MQSLPFEAYIAMAIVIFFAIGLHEYAHAKFADMAGDPTPAYYGRVTLNLFKHFDPLGTIMIIFTIWTGYGIGWGRPVPVDPRKMRNPRMDHFISVAAGPLSNLAQAVVWALLLRAVGLAPQSGMTFIAYLGLFGVMTNLSLCFFNLIPLGPLDGHWLVGALLPDRQRVQWYQFNRQMGGFILLGIIIFGQYSGQSLIFQVIAPPIRFLFRILVGIDAPI